MTSTKAVALAIGIPLGTCVLISLIGLAFALWRAHTSRRQMNNAEDKMNRALRRLDTFPKTWGTSPTERDFSFPEIKEAYHTVVGRTGDFVRRWSNMNESEHQLGSSRSPIKGASLEFDKVEESEDRIQKLLLDLPPKEHFPETRHRDLRLFRNPHNYTAAEIVAHLSSGEHDRKAMLQHILTAILLTAWTLDCNPYVSLLPFDEADLVDLAYFKTYLAPKLISSTFAHYITKYWFHREAAIRGSDQRLSHLNNPVWYKLAEDLLAPYYNPSDPVQIKRRHCDMKNLLGCCETFGLRTVATYGVQSEVDWKERKEGEITVSPEFRETDPNYMSTGSFTWVRGKVDTVVLTHPTWGANHGGINREGDW